MLTIHTITPLQTIPTMRFQHSRNRHVCFLDFASSCCVLPTTLMQSPGSAPRCKTCLTMTQQSRNMSVQPLGHFRASGERWPHEVALGVRQGTDPAGNTGCVRSRLGSGRKHWPRDVVVGVGQGTLARRGRGWGVAGNARQVGSRLGSGKEHWPCEVAVGAVILAACMCRIILGTFVCLFWIMVLQLRSQHGRKPENSIGLKRLRLLHVFFSDVPHCFR